MRAIALRLFPGWTSMSDGSGIVLSARGIKPGPYTPMVYETRTFSGRRYACSSS
jgi:hypothetical protein